MNSWAKVPIKFGAGLVQQFFYQVLPVAAGIRHELSVEFANEQRLATGGIKPDQDVITDEIYAWRGKPNPSRTFRRE